MPSGKRESICRRRRSCLPRGNQSRRTFRGPCPSTRLGVSFALCHPGLTELGEDGFERTKLAALLAGLLPSPKRAYGLLNPNGTRETFLASCGFGNRHPVSLEVTWTPVIRLKIQPQPLNLGYCSRPHNTFVVKSKRNGVKKPMAGGSTYVEKITTGSQAFD